MTQQPLNSLQQSALAALANGILLADEFDAGAAAVDAATQLARKIESGIHARVYCDGLTAAETIAQRDYCGTVATLDPAQIHELLGRLRADSPGFFKQLRMDVCALYLSDPTIWPRIGFPGPSSETGGYPDFDQPQKFPGV